MIRKYFITFFLFVTISVFGETEFEVPHLTVKGEATLHAPADRFTLQIGVENEGKEASRVILENREKMNKVIAAVEKLGFTKDEYSTGRYSLSPQYSPRPKNPPPNWRSEIVGYKISNSLTVRSQKIDFAGGLIDQSIKAGANVISSLQFGLVDEQKFRTEAIRKAAGNAKNDANTLAESLKLELKKVLYTTVEDDRIAFPKRPMMLRTVVEDTTPIEAGEIDVYSSVSVVFEVDQKGS